MADEKYTIEKILDAIKGSSGIKATIQRRLGCSRNTVDNYLRRYATAQAAYDEEVETIGDLAESVIIGAIRNKDVDTAKWYAKAKLKQRGYADQQEIKYSGGIVNAVTTLAEWNKQQNEQRQKAKETLAAFDDAQD